MDTITSLQNHQLYLPELDELAIQRWIDIMFAIDNRPLVPDVAVFVLKSTSFENLFIFNSLVRNGVKVGSLCVVTFFC